MEPYDAAALHDILWFPGWCLALLVLFVLGLRLPLQTRWSRFGSRLYAIGTVVAAVALAVLANVALVLHDVHFDLTREGVFTPSPQALAVVDHLQQDVHLTYFYQAQDPSGKRLKELLAILARRNPRLHVQVIDPDKQPGRAHTAGVRLYNAAVLETAGRRLVVQSTDDNDIAIGLLRVLRQRLIRVCFLEGHNEYLLDNFEFHTHLEGIHNHSHSDASSKVVHMPGHGIGRLRRALEALGYEVRSIVTATQAEIPQTCTVVVNANPRTTYLPGESVALEAYLKQGGALLLLYDLGFVIEPRLGQLLEHLGVRLSQEVILEPRQHYAANPEMVAVSGLEPHPITTQVAMTFFPGARALTLVPPLEGLTTMPLMRSSAASYTLPVAPVAERQIEPVVPDVPPHHTAVAPQSHLMAVAIEGSWPAPTPLPPFRAVVMGDADFVSNSFFPYLANSDLILAILRWLSRDERSTAMASRLPVPQLIVLSTAQMQQIFLLTEVVLPLSMLLLAALVWWQRR